MRLKTHHPMHDLFYAEMIDLKREIMTWGVILPLMILGYVGLLASYQPPFLDAVDMRVSGMFIVTFLVGLGCALVNRTHSRLAMWLAAWGMMLVAFGFLMIGVDGYTGIGISVACGVTALLLGTFTGWLSVVFSSTLLALYAIETPQLMLWPGKVAVIVVASVFITAMVQAFTRVLFRALRWTQANYEYARSQADAVTEKSGQLASALKSLEQTSFQLARANEQMEQAMRYAEEARLSKQQFAAAVSHELRAPLNLIIGFSDLVMNEPGNYQVALDPKLLADVRVINNHAQHLLKLVNDILDLSQMDVNYLSVTRSPVQLSDVIHNAVDDYQYLVSQRRLYLIVDIEPGLPIVIADATRIRQILTNLLSNALRVTSKGGITVRAHLSSNQDSPQPEPDVKSQIVISVSDTGIGIQPADLQRIFEPFVQVDDTIHHNHSGSGLGLTISKRFVELHGGQMWVNSEPDQGSTFFFSLPIADEQITISPHREPREVRRHEIGTLAIVERTAVLSRLIERYVAGIRVESVESIDKLCTQQECNAEIVLINEPIATNPEPTVLPDRLNRIPIFRCYVHGAMALPQVGGQAVGSTYDYLVKPIKREELYNVLARLLPTKQATHNRSARVLIIEDEEDALYLLSRMLRLAPPNVFANFSGTNIVKARSGEQALEILKELRLPDAPPIDVVLLDLVLGGVSGYAVLSEMERCEWLRDIPVCVITGQVASGDLLITPYVTFTRKNGLAARELAEAVVALTKIALPGVALEMR